MYTHVLINDPAKYVVIKWRSTTLKQPQDTKVTALRAIEIKEVLDTKIMTMGIDWVKKCMCDRVVIIVWDCR